MTAKHLTPPFIISLITFLTIALNVVAQQVIIIDQVNLTPIENVAIMNESKGIVVSSDRNGTVSLVGFSEEDTLVFRHPGFHPLKVAVKNILREQVTMRERLVKMDEVVVSSSKWEERYDEVPVKISGMERKEISFINAQTTADVLSNSGDVFVQKSQMGGGSPVIRGFEANKVLLVYDGVRMNNAIFRGGHLQNVILIDPFALERTEVVFGPGSVQYGSDALGGVMDFHTLSPRISSDKSLKTGFNFFVRHATANRDITRHVDFSISKGKFASTSSISFSDYGDLKTGNVRQEKYWNWGMREKYAVRKGDKDTIYTNNDPNLQRFTGYRSANIMQKVRYMPCEHVDINYGFHYAYTSDIPRYDRLSEMSKGTPVYTEWSYGPQKWMMNNLSAKLTKENFAYNQLRITGSWQKIEESRITRRYFNPTRRTQTENVNVFSVNIDADKKLLNDKINIFYGAEVVMNKVDSEAENKNILTEVVTPTTTRYPKGGSTMNTFAGYASGKWKIKEWVIFSAGGRYSYVKLDSKFDNPTFPFSELNVKAGAINGNAGFVVLPWDGMKMSFNLASGFRAPNVDDAGKINETRPGNVIVPNNDLAPEYATSFEVGVSQTFFKKISLSANGFYTKVEDLIAVRNSTFNGKTTILYEGVNSKVQSNMNVGNARIYGYNVSLEGDIRSDMSFKATVNYTVGKDIDVNVPLDHISPLFGQFRLIYHANKFREEAYINYNGWKRIADYSPSGEDNAQYATVDGTPAWYSVNFRSSYQFTRNIKGMLAVENIFNQHYRTFSSGVSAPGRNLIISANLSF